MICVNKMAIGWLLMTQASDVRYPIKKIMPWTDVDEAASASIFLLLADQTCVVCARTHLGKQFEPSGHLQRLH